MTRAVAPRFPVVAWIERRSRRQIVLASMALALLVVYRLLAVTAAAVLDRWWFDATTDAPVWRTQITARLLLIVATTVVTLGVLGGSVLVVLAAGRRIERAPNRVVAWYGARMGPAHGWILIALVGWITWRIATAASEQWQLWLLFREHPDLGREVPELGGDLGDYLFRLPFLAASSSFLRQLLEFTAAVSIVGHLLTGALRWPLLRRSQPVAVVHLALLGLAFTIVQALDYVLVRRPMLALDTSGSFDGAGYTELNVVRPGLFLLAVLAVLTGFALVWFLGGRSPRPVAAIAVTWAVAHLVVLVIAPFVVDRLVVAPAEAARQLPYLEHNIEATRSAYALADVPTTELALEDGATGALPAAARLVTARTPVFDPAQLPDALQVLQGTTGTRIRDVDIDRYEIDGEVRPVLVANRQPDRAGLPERGWVQEHLVYTHGDGVVAVPADLPDDDGRPDVDALVDELPHDPFTYFGEGLDGWYAVVGTDREQQGGAEYAGTAGVDLSSPLRRAVVALALGEQELLLSAELGDGSQLLYRRGLLERLTALAPFLTFDADPYPVIADGRVVWLADGYTTTSSYPYAEHITSPAPLAGNAVRLAVRATVDASTGDTHLYRAAAPGTAEPDPLLDAWDAIFPGLLEPRDRMPAAIAEHLRYPADQFVVQTSLLGRYHVEDPETFFNGTEQWSVSAAASTTVGSQEAAGPAGPVPNFVDSPASDATPWAASRPYSPGASSNPASGRDELAALAVASNDEPTELVLLAVDDAPGRQVASPRVAQGAIDADPELAGTITLLNANGSKVQYGPMTPLLIDDGVVWVRSILVTGTGATAIPKLYTVVAVSNGNVGQGADVTSAVEDAIAGDR